MCERVRVAIMLMTQEWLCADTIGLLKNASASAAARLWIHLCYQAVHGPFEEVPEWEDNLRTKAAGLAVTARKRARTKAPIEVESSKKTGKKEKSAKSGVEKELAVLWGTG